MIHSSASLIAQAGHYYFLLTVLSFRLEMLILQAYTSYELVNMGSLKAVLLGERLCYD